MSKPPPGYGYPSEKDMPAAADLPKVPPGPGPGSDHVERKFTLLLERESDIPSLLFGMVRRTEEVARQKGYMPGVLESITVGKVEIPQPRIKVVVMIKVTPADAWERK